MDKFYAVKVSSQPEFKVEKKLGFESKDEAQIYLEENNVEGSWVIIRSEDCEVVHAKGIISG